MAEVEKSVRLDIRLDGRLLFVQWVDESSFSCGVSGTGLSLKAQVSEEEEEEEGQPDTPSVEAPEPRED
jgi:hypothetical protein